MDVVEQQYKRAVFNVVARNQDDHVKNISFLMDQSGSWRLSPAYDVAYSYNPSGPWTRDHQMSMAGKRNDFSHADLLTFGSNVGLKDAKARQVIDDVITSVENWKQHAGQADVGPSDVTRIEKTFRLELRRR
jgi:serine/threonine-protein kinase HipA